MNKVRLGAVGLGMAWEKLHLPALLRLKDKFEIVALCDTDAAVLEKEAKKLGVPETSCYTDYNKMFSECDLDGVDIMVPIEKNDDAAFSAIRNNINVIAEKPLASCSKRARELVSLTNEHNACVLVAENFRYAEENKIIKRLLDENAIGEVEYFIDNNIKDFETEMRKDNFSAKEWRQHPKFNGGIFLDSGVHHVARMRYLFGACKGVYAFGKPHDKDFCPYSHINALLSFENKITGHYSFFCTGKEMRAPFVGFRIFGTEGEIFLEDKDSGTVFLSTKDGRNEAIEYKIEEGYYYELINFYDAVKLNKHIISTPEKEIGDIQVIEDILFSCEQNLK